MVVDILCLLNVFISNVLDSVLMGSLLHVKLLCGLQSCTEENCVQLPQKPERIVYHLCPISLLRTWPVLTKTLTH